MTQNITILLQSYYDHLSSSAKKIADYLLSNPDIDSSLTINDLAKQTGSSISTISRFAKSIGFNNFQQLKLSLLTSTQTFDTPFKEINANDTNLTVTKKIFSANVSTLDSTLKIITEDQLDKAVDIINNSQVIALFGLGASSVVAQDGYHKFLRSDKTPLFASDYHMQLMMATTLKPNSCAILISHSGENKDILEIAKNLRKNDIKIIGITSYGNSSLSKIVDVSLLSVSEETNYQNEALHAIIAQISLIDTLFVLTAIKDGQETDDIFKKIRKTINQTRNN
ncbi:MurR/RpiR family transcriptional regulator [Companilactobacillus allii]|uniref:Transcriptional regulator n=1 Tax=Companilactobacillus allii TaxID=1847728 RepID=A0A1P8Q5S3_9LACO|nr:MurR/RpiR family transcriptional regulator [Companilactobacillus allii]APX73224.1 transcriptional regulator [Companilactobacillus allii]USQ68035.1 MurR/RpiR family transcriptional regulator [Companilactobacillus allii]